MERNQDSGQSLVEYVLLVSVIAIGALGAITLFGGSLSTTTDVMATGNANMGGVTGGGTIGTGPAGTSSYDEAYTGNLATASVVGAAYDASSPRQAQMAFNAVNTICGTEAGATPAERCQALQGLPVTVTNADGSTTTTYPDGTVETSLYDSSGNGYTNTVNPDGSSVRVDTAVDSVTGVVTTTTTTTAVDGTVTTTVV